VSSPQDLERDIEKLRDNLADNIDQLIHRASPKTIADRQMQTTKAHFVAADGAPRTDNIMKVVGGVVAVVVVFAIIRKIAR
jgi:hypothetical protein